ncbi:MAG: CHASE3 domain-containing protein [Ktedonobacterales bacterium]|nr:CHASE3 domain-containing protein [Ktedonobacterales bacterium]
MGVPLSIGVVLARGRVALAWSLHGVQYRSKHLSNRGLALLFSVFVLVLLANSGIAYLSAQAHTSTDDRIAHTELVLGDLAAIANNLDNAETGQRGYILTGIASYLDPYNTSRANIGARLDQLTTDLGASPAQQAALARLSSLVTEKYTEMQQTIDLRQNNQTQQAQQIILSGQGKQEMDDIRGLLATMRSREEASLRVAEVEASRSLAEMNWAFVFAAVVDLALLGVIGWLVYRTLSERSRLLAREREAVELRDHFLSIASHELKTPLTALLINAQLLERRLAQEETAGAANRRSVDSIVRQTRRLQALIDAMLDVSRIANGQLSIQRERLDLTALVQSVVRETATSSERHTIVYEGPDEPLIVEGDRLRLEEVLLNLVQNAIKYSPNGGTVTARLRAGDRDAYIAVSDQGIGIRAADVPHLFDRFYRGTNTQGSRISGMGIGLSVAREVAALHGGEVTVASVEGQGSTFTLRLPLAPPAATATGGGSAPTATPAGRRAPPETDAAGSGQAAPRGDGWRTPPAGERPL